MRPNTLALALALAVFALPMSALAQDSTESAEATPEAAQDEAPAADADAAAEEATPNWTWNLSLTSDYVFRGVTQTNFKPAVQGGLDYSFGDSGWYVGFWSSNVDFNDSDGPDVELDTYVGWGTELNDDWALDFSLLHYSYFGERNAYGSVDYTEVISKTTWKDMLTFTVAYAPDYANLDYTSVYINLGGSWDVGNDFNINAGFGHTIFGDNNGTYNDWNLGVSRQFGPVNAALNYYDTDIDGDNVSDTIVLTIAFGNG